MFYYISLFLLSLHYRLQLFLSSLPMRHQPLRPFIDYFLRY